MSSNGDSGFSFKKESKKPKYSKFTQQELPACKPLLTPAWVIGTLFLIGAVFIPLGAISLAASNKVVEIVTRYDDQCLPGKTNEERDASISDYSNPDKSCSLQIVVPKKMKAPVFVYYQLNNFYQNHRRYVKSRSDSQLRGTEISGSGFDSCKPEAYLGDNNTLPITPCGLIAWSLFNDTYTISDAVSKQPLFINERHISWASDRNTKFGKVYPKNFNTDPAKRGGATLDPNKTLSEDEHLIVWMRTAALPTFRKLYGRIESDLEADTTLSISLNNYYNSYRYHGKKWIVLSTASWLGGKNSFIGVAYFVVGGLCVFLSIAFFILHLIKPRKLGDTSYLSWNKKPPGVN